MFIRYLILYLGGLLWLLSGCSLPLTPAPTPTQAPTTTTPTVAPEWVTATAMAGFTPTPTTEPTALPATNTPLSTNTIVPTHSSSPMATTTPRPVWVILFSGIPCPKTYVSCDDTLFMDESPRHYFIKSDGTDLKLLEEVQILPAGLNHLRYITFSHDKSRIAYVADGTVFITRVDKFDPIQLEAIPQGISGFDFLPEKDCLAFYRTVSRELDNAREIVIEKNCANSLTTPDILTTINFPDVMLLARFYPILSPQADKLLVYGRDADNIVYLYVKHIDDNQQPRLLFRSPDICPNNQYNYAHRSIQWSSENETIEFLTSTVCDNDQIINMFFITDWKGENLTTRLEINEAMIYSLSNPIWFGDWSPNNQEFVFTYQPGLPGEASGLYRLDFESGEIQQILSEFFITSIRTWIPGTAEQ